MGLSISALDLCIVVLFSISIMAIAYLPIVSVVYVTLSTHKRVDTTNPWRHWVQFSLRELLLLVLTVSVVLAFRNFTISVIAIATFLSHSIAKRAATKTLHDQKELYSFFFGGVFCWVAFGAYGASSQYARAATRWEILSSGSWQNSISVVLGDLLNFLAYGLWGLILSAMILGLSPVLNWILSDWRKGQGI